jgi:curved DNA-binding protein CbpA
MARPVEPDYYEVLGVDPTATQEEIQSAYEKLAAELRVSKVEDAPEELVEVEEARSILADPAKRAQHDAKVRAADAEEAKKDAELDAYLQRSGRRHSNRNRRTGGLLGMILDLLSLGSHHRR